MKKTLLLVGLLLTYHSGFAQSPQERLQNSGVKGGLVVHIDCNDGKLTTELALNDNYLVHGLDTSIKDVQAARRHVLDNAKHKTVQILSAHVWAWMRTV